MKTKTLLLTISLFLITNIFAQKGTIELTFTAIDDTIYQQLDSVKIINRSLYGIDTVLYYPDTVITLTWFTGMNESMEANENFQVFQNYPNPVIDQTTISMFIPEKDIVQMIITDVLGRTIHKSEKLLENGHHSFKFEPGEGNLFFFTAHWNGKNSSIKIINNDPHNSNSSALTYMGRDNSDIQLKTGKSVLDFVFYPGNTLLYVGYAGDLESGITNIPEDDMIINFQFAYDIPCPGLPEISYEGQVYPTIQIFSQCWLRMNLSVGTIISSTVEMTDNDTIEKYCPENNPTLCDSWQGALYQWDEIMHYNNNSVQGICPPGWHIPTDLEFKIVEGAADSQYRIGNLEWDVADSLRGFDAGKNLKSTLSWSWLNGTDLLGFWGLPKGYRHPNGTMIEAGWFGCFWTRTVYGNDAWGRVLYWDNDVVGRLGYYAENGFAVRCIMD